MRPLTPYRTLSGAQRLQLVTHVVATNRESRDGFVRAMVSRGGGFRPEKLRKWPAEQLAREVVRYNLETLQDELQLLIALYLEVQPELQTEFLEAAGVPHDGAQIPEDLATPFADAAKIRDAATALIQRHGDDARRYLRTISLYNGEAWPGLADFLGEGT